MSTAAGLYQSLVGLVLILVANYIVRQLKKIMRSSNPRRCTVHDAAIHANRESAGKAFKEERLQRHLPIVEYDFNIVIGIFSFSCIFPFLFVIIISLTDEQTLVLEGFEAAAESVQYGGVRIYF